MKQKTYIAVLGRIPETAEELKVALCSVVETHSDSEVNFFDLPHKKSIDSGRWLGNIFVHHYAQGNRTLEIARDIIALGPILLVILGEQNQTTHHIADIIKHYGIDTIHFS